MARESCYTPTEESTKGSGLKITNMERVLKSFITELYTKGPTLKASPKVMEDIIGITDKPTKDSGKME